MGRRDTTVAKDFELQVLLASNLEVEAPVPKIVKVEVIGPRVAVKKFTAMSPVFTVDLRKARAGRQIVQVPREGLNLPIGTRLLNIEPHEFTITLRETSSSGESH